jgi:hypothetical protein
MQAYLDTQSRDEVRDGFARSWLRLVRFRKAQTQKQTPTNERAARCTLYSAHLARRPQSRMTNSHNVVAMFSSLSSEASAKYQVGNCGVVGGCTLMRY